MENLLQNLQRTIRALETLSEKGIPESDRVDELLDQFFQQKIDLVNLNPTTSSALYQQAAQALGNAAARAEKIAKDPSHFRDIVPTLNDAIGKLAKLLNQLAV